MDPTEHKSADEEVTRLRWRAEDEELGYQARSSRPELIRTASAASSAHVSVHSHHRRTIVDPSVSLPIHYRTMYLQPLLLRYLRDETV
jgi:hypothetical protein